jgi:hypothetical protein
MALRVAVATGNWSNPAIWNAGVLPQSGDVVASNGFTVTIDQNINVDLLTNTVQSPVIITPAMTSNTTPSGIVSASSIFSVTYDFWRAFDRGGQDWLTAVSTLTGWVAYEFPTVKVVAKYTMFPPGNGSPTSAPRDWTFEGWTGSAWVILDTVTGNSGSASVTRSISNTTAYIKYRLNITANNGNINYTGVYELYLYEANDFAANSVAGGGFVLTNGVTVTCTNELRSGNSTLLLWSGTTGNTIVSPKAVGAGSGRLIDVAGTGTLNINITTLTGVGGVAPTLVHVGAAATVNIVGTFEVAYDLRGTMLNIAAAATVNVTGNFIRNFYTNNTIYTIGIVAANSILNITGDIITGIIENYWNYEWNLAAVYTINITGSLKTIAVPQANMVSIFSTTAGYLKIIGPIITYGNHVLYRNTNSLAINLFTGPFVCSTYGYVPLQVVRMHLIPTTSSYFEFRDETTNGALSPGGIAPATQLVSPATLISNLATSDVRFGIVYALGTLTGTLRMPVANQVTFGVAVDNTFGNSVLTAASIWDYLVSNITTADSIGMRLKNVATPQTTGEQLEAFLRLD